MSKRSSILLVAAFFTAFGVMGCGIEKVSAPVDTVAPSAVLDLAVGVDMNVSPSVNLNWSAGAEADLAAYNVYRSENGGVNVLVGSETAPTFRDGTVQRGATYVYSVTAVDMSSNESAPSTTSVTVPTRVGAPGRVQVD